MMQSKGIITPVLKYWGFSKHPFDEFILKNDTLDLFVDRQEQLHMLHNAITGRLCAVYGSQGSGKSSFLRKFEQTLNKADIPTLHVQLMGTNERDLYREILSVFLHALLNGTIKIESKLKLDIKVELEKVEYGITLSKESEIGAQSIIKATTKEIKQKRMEPHSEESSRLLIRDIIRHSKSFFAVIIDDMERIKHFLEDEDSYFRFVTSFAQTVGESFNDERVCFIISIDNIFVNRLNKNLPGDEGFISFSFSELTQLTNFTPQIVIELIRSRLHARGLKKSVKDFIAEDALLLLYFAGEGHPRRTLALLRSAMEFVEMNKKTAIIDSEAIYAAIDRRGENFNHRDFQIITYLYKNGPTSPSDEAFQKAVSLTRNPLSLRLKSLVKKIRLKESQVTVGKTTKDLYTLSKIEL